MAHNIQVRCKPDRFWDPLKMKWCGKPVNGTLIDVSTQSAEDNSGKIIPVGIVLLENNTFQCIPMEFIKKIKAE